MECAMNQYLIVIEKGERNYSAFSPDVLGCVATGKTIEKTVEEMKSALRLHLSEMLKDGDALPTPKGIEFHLTESQKTEEPFLEAGDYLTYIPIEVVLPDDFSIAA